MKCVCVAILELFSGLQSHLRKSALAFLPTKSSRPHQSQNPEICLTCYALARFHFKKKSWAQLSQLLSCQNTSGRSDNREKKITKSFEKSPSSQFALCMLLLQTNLTFSSLFFRKIGTFYLQRCRGSVTFGYVSTFSGLKS